jgi:hypothetical protein
MRHKALDTEDRRRISFENRYSSTMAFVSTAPAKASQVPQALFAGAVALVAEALEPITQAALDSRIGNTNLRADLHGDALGAAALPGGSWRMAHAAFKQLIFLDAKYLGVAIRKEVYGMFTRFFDLEGREERNRLSERETRTPDRCARSRLEPPLGRFGRLLECPTR